MLRLKRRRLPVGVAMGISASGATFAADRDPGAESRNDVAAASKAAIWFGEAIAAEEFQIVGMAFDPSIYSKNH